MADRLVCICMPQHVHETCEHSSANYAAHGDCAIHSIRSRPYLLDHYAKHQRRLQMLMSMALQKA